MAVYFKPGDCVIYRKRKYSVHPSPKARDIYPAQSGDFYSYSVDKYWTVVAVQPDHTLVVCTRRGKQLTLADDDPALRRAHWWERFLFRRRFPTLTPAT
jgi:hypothetical protein